MLYLPALIVAAVLMACGVVVLVVSEKAEATFPGKNGKIAYNGNGVIYTIHPDGSAKTKVTNTYVSGDPIDYSPDGKKITYTSYEGFNDGSPTGPQKDSEIYTINVDRTGKFQVTNNNRYDSGSSYSPDGKRIAYSHYDGHDDEIYTINTDGTRKFQVTNNDTNEFYPSYSPDGKKIVFSGEHRKLFPPWTYTADIYTIGVNGNNRVKLTYNSTYDYSPTTPPTAGGSPSRAPKVSGTPRSTRSALTGEVRPKSRRVATILTTRPTARRSSTTQAVSCCIRTSTRSTQAVGVSLKSRRG